jgi:multisubunit Na+/H+ antiporter MnhB subunit
MTKKTAMFIGFLLSTSSIIVILVFLFFRDKEVLKPMLYIGIGLGAASLVLRNLLRFKPDMFKDNEEKK